MAQDQNKRLYDSSHYFYAALPGSFCKITARLECKCLFLYSTCISINFFVVFKILVSSISNVDDYSCSIFFELRNPDNGVYWVATENSLYIRNGKKIMEFPWVVPPGKINDLSMSSNHKSFI